jgi:hypothetical protein
MEKEEEEIKMVIIMMLNNCVRSGKELHPTDELCVYAYNSSMAYWVKKKGRKHKREKERKK